MLALNRFLHANHARTCFISYVDNIQDAAELEIHGWMGKKYEQVGVTVSGMSSQSEEIMTEIVQYSNAAIHIIPSENTVMDDWIPLFPTLWLLRQHVCWTNHNSWHKPIISQLFGSKATYAELCACSKKDRTVLFNHTLSSINADKPLGSVIKMGYSTQPLTAVKCKHSRSLTWVCCPLASASFKCVLSSWVFVSSLWLTWLSVCWQLVSGDGANTDAGSVADSLEAAPPLERTGGIGDSRPPSYQSVYSEQTVTVVFLFVCNKEIWC